MSTGLLKRGVRTATLFCVMLFLFLAPLSTSLTYNQPKLQDISIVGNISANITYAALTNEQTEAAIIAASPQPSYAQVANQGQNSFSNTPSAPAANANQDPSTSNSNPASAAPAKNESGFWANVTNALINLPKALGAWIGEAFLSFCAFLVWMGGSVLQYATTELVFGMGTMINNSGLGSSIDTAWKTVRDICNLAFIFGLIYIGINTIIDYEKASPKRFLSKIIIGALLINFSLFFVKFIIDFSNLTAYHIFTSMTSGSGSISAKIADVLGIVTIYSAPSGQTMQNLGTGSLWFYLGAGIFLLIAAFTLLAAGIMLIGRFVALVLIMVFSPILFAATVFPKTESYASKLWSNLISYAFFAPVYFLLLFISITVLENFPLKGSKNFVKAMVPDGSSSISDFGTIVFFIVAIFFMISALTIAQKMGVAGGSMAISIGKDLRGRGQRFVGGATFGVGAKLGRATVGRVAQNVSEREGLKDKASQGGIGGWTARQALKTSRRVGDSSFDARNVAGAGKTLGIGEGRKGGYKTVMGEVEKKEKEFAQSLGEVDDTDVRVQGRKKDWENAQKTQKAESETLRKQLRDTSPLDVAGRKTLQEKIDKLEKNTKEAQITYEKEKQRRIIGSTYSEPENATIAGTAKTHIDALETSLNTEWASYSALTDDALKRAKHASIQSKMDDLKKKKAEYAKMMRGNDGGYAGVLESASRLSSWPTGRLAIQNNEAGKAIRKSAEKGLPKQKE